MFLFESSTHEWRRWIGTSGVTFNTLRVCARRAYTVYELSKIRLYQTPGLSRSVMDVLSEINVTVESGECERRELLVTVSTSPDPATSGGKTSLLRTTIFAFLLHPGLARAEPSAYEQYVRAWAALPQTQEAFARSIGVQFSQVSESELRALYEFYWRTGLVFPDFLRSRWLVLCESAALDVLGELTSIERKRVFGEYYLADLKTIDEISDDHSHHHTLKHLFSPLQKGIPQHAEILLKWFDSPVRAHLEDAFAHFPYWIARTIRWQLHRVERRTRQLAQKPPLNADWRAEPPPTKALMPGRFGLSLH
ncbi:hypothetical protein HY009_05850 [Candidatus Acetothermia bacterium]|nr:hypothetical protein [Candidatus Acetothermia bacterium]